MKLMLHLPRLGLRLALSSEQSLGDITLQSSLADGNLTHWRQMKSRDIHMSVQKISQRVVIYILITSSLSSSVNRVEEVRLHRFKEHEGRCR
jgi:hypothetical protein